MPSAARRRDDFSAATLRALAKRSKDADQSRRLLSLAAAQDGMDHGSAARIGGMDRQTRRDGVHRFNAAGPDGLLDHWTNGPTPRLKPEQLAELAAIVEAGRIASETASRAGGGLTSSGSSPSASTSTIARATSERC
jgi:transposase